MKCSIIVCNRLKITNYKLKIKLEIVRQNKPCIIQKHSPLFQRHFKLLMKKNQYKVKNIP